MEENGELGERLFPAFCRQDGRDVGVFQGKIDQFERRLIRREGSLCFYDFPDLAIDRLDGVGGVNDRADGGRIGQERGDLIPMSLPQRRDGGIFVDSFFGEAPPSLASGGFRRRSVDGASVLRDRPSVFP